MPISTRFLASLFGSVAWWSGVALSIALYLMTMQMVTEKSRKTFENQAHQTSMAIQASLRSYADALRGMQALFAASEEVTRAQFGEYVEQLQLKQNSPGILSLNFAPRIFESERAGFERALRAKAARDPAGAPAFAITPPGTRTEYQVLTFLEPMEPTAFGRDIAATAWGADALAFARDTGQLTSSGRIVESGGAEQIVGLSMRMPLYRHGMPLDSLEQRRAAYYGSVGARFDVNALILGAVSEKRRGAVRVRLFDAGPVDADRIGAPEPGRLLFDSAHAMKIAGNDIAAPGRSNGFMEKVSMNFGPRQWQAEFSARPSALAEGLDRFLPWIMLIGGLAGSTLLFATHYSLVTARRRAVELAREMTKDLRSSEASLAEVQHMARFGSWVLDLEQMHMTWSLETCRILGIGETQGAPTYSDFIERVHPGDREALQEGLARVFERGEEFRLEHRINTCDGATRWVHSIVQRANGEQKQLRGALRDITERRQTMEALERSQELLRELTAHQDRVKEDERKRIAREIHDELGQTLLALRIDVSMLEARTGKSHPRLNQKVRGALHQIDTTVRTIRNIINNLRPAVLDLGLTAAIEWQVAQFRRRSGIACQLTLSDEEFAIDDARATSLFRILQESLTNVVRHANASTVRIELRQQDEWLVMCVCDNGVGMYPGDRRNNSFGLIGVEERVHALNGEFFLNSPRGEGTTLTVRIPLNDSASPQVHMNLCDSG